MQSDDVFRRDYIPATDALEAWARQYADVARVEHEWTTDFFRLALIPHVDNACPVELILHPASQTYDLMIGTDVWEGQAIETLGAFEPLLESVVAGRVVSSRHESSLSGARLGTATHVTYFDGSTWQRDRTTSNGVDGAWSVRYRHWLPYRRL